MTHSHYHLPVPQVVHIDFGDCWEVTQTRKKFPEKVPFRFTRMLENAMELAGRDGIFRSTAETVVRVLREHRMSAEVRRRFQGVLYPSQSMQLQLFVCPRSKIAACNVADWQPLLPQR